jgi:hypothetical protein
VVLVMLTVLKKVTVGVVKVAVAVVVVVVVVIGGSQRVMKTPRQNLRKSRIH